MPPAIRFLVSWPDGQRDRVEAGPCGDVTYAQGRCCKHIWRVWIEARAEIEADGARIQSVAAGELWPAE
jgi:hypothetical protein